MTRLSAIRKRLEVATPGPWASNPRQKYALIVGTNPPSYIGKVMAEDADLIAHAPQDLRDLLELAEAVMDQQRAVREPTSKKNLNDAIMRAELAMRRLGAEVEVRA